MTIEHTAVTRRSVLGSVSALAATIGLAVAAPLPDLPTGPDAVEPIEGPYRFTMVGTSASPMVEPGDIISAEPALEPKTNTLCVFLRADQGTARVGVLADMDDDTWTVQRFIRDGGWHPTRHELARSDWPHCHRITRRQLV
jgi:hypothetical protein